VGRKILVKANKCEQKMTDSLEKRRYSISQSGKFKQKYKQRQQISVEIYSPEVNTAQVSVLNEICKGSKVYDEVRVKLFHAANLKSEFGDF
jgi:hypothetical protein